MDEEKSVADAIRELEDDFAAGRIGSKEFVRAMKELLARRTPGPASREETWAEPPRPAAPAAPDPEEAGPAPAGQRQAPAPPSPVARPKPAAKAPDHLQTPWNQSDLPPIRVAKPDAGKPRVIVKGAAPWEREEEAVRFESLEAKQRRSVSGGIIHDGQGLLRERLATMADGEVKGLMREKDPNAAALLSLLLGGGGQFYLESYWAGAAFLAVYLLAGLGLVYGEWWVLYVLAPAQVLSAALAQREAEARNRSIEIKLQSGDRMRSRMETTFDPDKAVRRTQRDG